MAFDILINFLTAYQSNDICWVDDICKIAQNYAKGNLLFDLCATIPGIATGQSATWYWFKLIRFIHLRDVYNGISLLIKGILSKMNLTKSSVEKTSYSFNLIIYMFSAIHILGCSWIYIGKTVECSWIKGGCDAGGTVVEVVSLDDNGEQTHVKEEERYLQYVTSIYWVITTLTTVGYGDYKGYTPEEYMFQMIIEFLGIGTFSFLMGSINGLVGSERKLQDIIDERIEDIEQWLRRLEKSRSKNFDKQLYDSIKEYTIKSYQYDYN